MNEHGVGPAGDHLLILTAEILCQGVMTTDRSEQASIQTQPE